MPRPNDRQRRPVACTRWHSIVGVPNVLIMAISDARPCATMSEIPHEISERAQHDAEGADRPLYTRRPAGGIPDPGARSGAQSQSGDHPQCHGRPGGTRLCPSPHTSAGRVPTVQGYRFFVDTLLKVQPLDRLSVERLRAEFEVSMAPKELIEATSEPAVRHYPPGRRGDPAQSTSRRSSGAWSFCRCPKTACWPSW